MATKVSLEEAVNTVETLDEISLPDYQPCIEALSGSVVYEVNLDSNFEDKTAYITGISKYIEEAAIQAQLNKLLEQGNEHAIMLYTWRCCSRSIPQVKSNDQVDRIEIYEKTVEVLLPHVNKLMQLMKFQTEAIAAFCTEMRRLCHPKKEKEFVSEAYLLTLGKFINMFAVLDELKNMKSSVKNDHSAFRRAAQFRKSDSYAGLESQNLSMFLATNDIIRSNLKKALDDVNNGIPGYEEILCDVINTSVQMFDNKLYLLPQEKHILVKVIGFSLSLLDGDVFNIYKLDSKKKINMSQIDKIFKQCKVVPLYGDMQIAPFNYVKRTKNYDPSKWPACNSSNESNQGRILEQVDRIRMEHTNFISELSKYSNEVI
jgi:cytoplasmic FMR1 interacting protein